MRVLITGASGVLGSAIYQAFKRSGSYHVLGTAYTRAQDHPDLTFLNLLDELALEQAIQSFKPDWLIHTAAERRPDIAERDPDAATKLNVNVTSHLGRLANQFNYVFDGLYPPYSPDSETNPLQLYGRTKRDGELALEHLDNKHALILRVPVLYGPAPKNSDSAVNILLDIVQDQSGKLYKMDHFAVRYPTNVLDIADFLARLSLYSGNVPKILHYSGAEPFTKYEMCLIFSQILGVPHRHIIPESDPPTGIAATTRPRDCHLDCRETDSLRVEGGMGLCGFEEWWGRHLKGEKQS
ncbi:hypothetical protein Clacol_009318 [Clathrus columnatus]|uniref:RmlD-like substrate binding domain-containing protein n=1 Tax=Clathrus columnatus TaxID=1419009 RepID=A0AAV5AQS6_9AGAM|nr:hypothetical protein Clacol_009318 [Clathrus columnatus]